MVSCLLVHWLLVVFCVMTHLHSGESRSELFCHQFCVSWSVFWGLILRKGTEIGGFFCSLPTISFSSIRVWIEIQILAISFNQRYKSVPKAVVFTCFSIYLFPFYNLILQHKDTKMKYKFWLYFSTKGINHSLKLLYLLVLKWPQSYLSGELSDSIDSPFCLVLKALR